MTVSASGVVVSTDIGYIGDAVLAVTPDHPALAGPRWLMLWSVDPLGECTCPRGSWRTTAEHGESIGTAEDCGTGPGKHPWALRERGGSWRGYRHGAQDAHTRAEALAEHGEPGPRRRWGITLADIIVIDIDSPAAMRAFYRIRHHIQVEQMLGVARTPRGWHIYLSVPGWTQRALNSCMRSWLARDWHGTDVTKISQRGLLLDVRTGDHRYTVWPGDHSVDRRWATTGEFTQEVNAAGRYMPKDRVIVDGSRAPWNIPMSPELQDKIASCGQDTYRTTTLAYDGSRDDKLRAWNQLTAWCRRLSQMTPESGRNNRLNATAFHAGSEAIRAGIPQDKVRKQLLAAAAACGCPGAEATINSGLSAGLARVRPT